MPSTRWRSGPPPYDSALIYGGKFSDDVLARALDRLFETDRTSLLTSAVLQAVKADGVDLSQIHQDTTSVKLTGACQKQQRRAVSWFAASAQIIVLTSDRWFTNCR
jgi:hypothetical protein